MYDRYKALDVKVDRNVLRVTMNRPDELNAINAAMYDELSTIFIEAGGDPTIDVVVFTGAGRAFSAGGDWNWMRQQIADPNIILDSLPHGKRMVLSILDCEKPVICRLNGDAIGLGCTLALMCDFVIAVDTARLADPHVKVGLVAGDGGALAWTHLVGYARARNFILTGDYLPASEAASIGLITRVVAAEDLDDVVEALVCRMATSAARAVAWSKVVLNAPLKEALTKTLPGALAFESLSSATPDHNAAVEAFLAHQKPEFESQVRGGWISVG